MNSLKLIFAFTAFTLLSGFTTPTSITNTDLNLDGSSPQIQYRIQLCTYDQGAPTKDMKLMNEIGGIISVQSKGKMAYLTAPFSTEEEASRELPSIRQKGFKRAMKVVVVEDYVIPSRTYHFFYDKRKCSAADKNKLFTPEIKVLDQLIIPLD